jgi:alpha-tubulin suppressor-like RCC1 family protein
MKTDPFPAYAMHANPGVPKTDGQRESLMDKGPKRRWRLWRIPLEYLLAVLMIIGIFVPIAQAGGYFNGGAIHSLALKEDGTVVWAWGYNAAGQLGDGTQKSSAIPVKTQNLTNVRCIAAGDAHSLALTTDGMLWAWGNNSYGQLGDGTTENRIRPVKIQNLTNILAVVAGSQHNLVLRSDGTVWAWGGNSLGQLGDGTTENRRLPVQVRHLTGVKAISARDSHSLAVKNDGTVWAWGWNDNGQLGNGTAINQVSPIQVQNLTDISAIAAGVSHSLALRSDGTVWAWGQNFYSQLGDGTTVNQMLPVQVQNLTDVTAIATGGYHGLALKGDKTVWAWGINGSGQLGDGTWTNKSTPVQVLNLTGVIAISPGGLHTVVIKSDGTVWAWGANYQGQLGDGTRTNRNIPVSVVGSDGLPLYLRPVVLIPATTTEGAGILQGVIRYSEAPATDLIVNLTSSDPSEVTVPATVTIPAGQASVTFELTVMDDTLLDGTQNIAITAAAAGYPTDSSAIAVNDNETAALTVVMVPTAATEGDGILFEKGTVRVSTAVERDTFVFLTSSDATKLQIPGKIAIPAGQTAAPFDLTIVDNSMIDGTKMVTVTASVPGWASGSAALDVADNETKVLSLTIPAIAPEGRNVVLEGAGKVGISGTLDFDLVIHLSSNDPSEVTVPPTVTIPAGQTSVTFDLTIADDGIVDGLQSVIISAAVEGWISSNANMAVSDRDGLNISPNLAGGGSLSMALRADGTLLSWGCTFIKESDGLITCGAQNAPQFLLNLPNVVSAAGSSKHALAIGGDQTVWTWGANDAGQLGDGTTNSTVIPVQVANLTAITALSGGFQHSLALKNDGTVWDWGANWYGQLGDGTTDSKATPVQVPNLTSITAISAGSEHSLALKGDGAIWAWGYNYEGELGDGTTTDRSVPVKVVNLTDVFYIAAGSYHNLALKSDGTVWAWGAN